ncbi:MAG: tetratricopeptide repeat protein [Planctomycetaceae bacterium]
MPPAPVRLLLCVSLGALLLAGCTSPSASVRDRLREVSAAFPHWPSNHPAHSPTARRAATEAKLALSNSRLKAEHLELQIEEALRSNNAPHAATLCEDLLELDSRSVFAHHHLAVLADQQGRYADAEQHYLAALDVEPHNADLLSSLGWSYLLQGRSSEALQVLQQALVHHPGHATAVFNLGWLAGLQGDDSRALAYFRRQVSDVEAEQLLSKVRTEARERHLTDRSNPSLQAPDPRVARGGATPTPPTTEPAPATITPRLATRPAPPQPPQAPTELNATALNTTSADLEEPDSLVLASTEDADNSDPDAADSVAADTVEATAATAETPADGSPQAVQLVENLSPAANPNAPAQLHAVEELNSPATPPAQPVTTARSPQPAVPPSEPRRSTNQPRGAQTPELTIDEVWQIGRTLLGPAERASDTRPPRPLAPATPDSQLETVSRETNRPAPGPAIPSAAHRRALQRGLELGHP